MFISNYRADEDV